MSTEDTSVEVIEKLKKVPRIGEKAARALFKEGYDLRKLSTAIPQDIVKILGCSNREAKLLIAKAYQILKEEILPPLRANEYEEEMKEKVKWYKTGSKKLDMALGGGFRSYSTVALAGPQASGKTQIVNQLLLETVCRHKRMAVFFETELNTFSNRRLREMASARGWKYDPKMVILVPAQRIRDVGTQYYQYEKVYDLITSQHLDVGIIIVDSLTALFQRKYSGREVLPDRKAELGRHLSYLEEMAKEFNALLLFTCQVIECPISPSEAKGAFSSADVRVQFGTNYMVWGGHVLRHFAGTWISCVKISKDVRKLVIFDSSELDEQECLIKITRAGIEDYEEKKIV